MWELRSWSPPTPWAILILLAILFVIMVANRNSKNQAKELDNDHSLKTHISMTLNSFDKENHSVTICYYWDQSFCYRWLSNAFWIIWLYGKYPQMGFLFWFVCFFWHIYGKITNFIFVQELPASVKGCGLCIEGCNECLYLRQFGGFPITFPAAMTWYFCCIATLTKVKTCLL